MKRFRRAATELADAANLFQKNGGNKSAKTASIMSMLSNLEFSHKRGEMLNIFQKLASSTYQEFLGRGFIVPEFQSFDKIVLEGQGWINYFLGLSLDNEPFAFNKYLNAAALDFFNLGHCPLIYERIVKQNWETSNTQMALICLAKGEEALGNHYIGINDEKKACIHLEGAIFSYSNIAEREFRAKATGIRRQRSALRMERTCWICGSRVRGFNSTFSYICTNRTTTEKNFYRMILDQRRKFLPQLNFESIYSTDEGNILIDNFAVEDNFLHPGKQGIYVSVCKACESVVNELADIIAERRIIPVRNELAMQQQQIGELTKALIATQEELAKVKKTADEVKRKVMFT